MTQSVGEIAKINPMELRPLDDRIAEGVALNGLFTEIQQQRLSSRLIDSFGDLRSDPDLEKERRHCVALNIGKLSLQIEDQIDELAIKLADEQNHGMRTVNTIKEDVVDVIWTGYDPNTTRLLKLYKHSTPIFMTNGELHPSTLWGLIAKPGSIRS